MTSLFRISGLIQNSIHALEEFKEIFLLIKEYIQKQKENISLGAAESMTRLFYAATVGIVMLVLIGIALLLASFALAFWINEVTDSAILGFASLAGIMLFIALISWGMRRRLILQPIARMMVRIFLEADMPGNYNTPKAQQ